MTTSELALSSVAWPTLSTTKHDILSAVSEKISVGSGKMKGHYLRTLDKVADEASFELLMLDTHDTTRAAENGLRSSGLIYVFEAHRTNGAWSSSRTLAKINIIKHIRDEGMQEENVVFYATVQCRSPEDVDDPISDDAIPFWLRSNYSR
ncbi:hypothetical protein EDB87DRAFT_1826247 [Lactarius vividus]|nr:hypothetical protein EDB87DRAFT_1826247 [Lactarius vividus]